MRNKPERAPVPQLVKWGPTEKRLPGIVVIDDETKTFVPWPELEMEIENMLLPQVRVVPIDSTVVLADLGDRNNWIVRITGATGEELGHIWFGTDPNANWQWDGLVRLGNPSASADENPVWQVFQRCSDGTYRRVKAFVVK